MSDTEKTICVQSQAGELRWAPIRPGLVPVGQRFPTTRRHGLLIGTSRDHFVQSLVDQRLLGPCRQLLRRGVGDAALTGAS